MWVMEKELGMLEMVLEEGRRNKLHFSKVTRKAKAETLKCFCSRKGSVPHMLDILSKITTVRSWKSVL